LLVQSVPAVVNVPYVMEKARLIVADIFIFYNGAVVRQYNK